MYTYDKRQKNVAYRSGLLHSALRNAVNRHFIFCLEFMIKIVITRSLILILLCTIIIACDLDKDDTGSSPLARVTFFNQSSHPVDIFKNFNPQSFDPTTYIGTVDAISRALSVHLPASTDQLIGDIFYLRFKILLQDSHEVVTTGLFIPAERTMSNITLVVKSGESYTKIIEDPPANELRFVNGIIKVQNLTTGQHWIESHGVILPQLGRETAWLTLGQFGFYELVLPFLAESWPMDSLQSRDSHGNRTPFPSFVMERGYIYPFQITNTDIIPLAPTPINPLGN